MRKNNGNFFMKLMAERMFESYLRHFLPDHLEEEFGPCFSLYVTTDHGSPEDLVWYTFPLLLMSVTLCLSIFLFILIKGHRI